MSAGSTDGSRPENSWAMSAEAASLRVLQEELGQIFGLAYARLRSPIWVFDFDRKRVLWGNTAALDLWRAPDLEELLCRDLGIDMSPSVAARLMQYREDFERRDVTFSEVWTLYPQGQPRTLHVIYSGLRLSDGRMALFCEGISAFNETPETLRSAEALLHTSVLITLYDLAGMPLYRNPAARSAAPRDDSGPGMPLGSRFVDAHAYGQMLAELTTLGEAKLIARMHTAAGERWHAITARECHDAATGAPARLLTEVDVTETKLYQRRLEESQDQLERQTSDLRLAQQGAEAASRAKSSFLAHMSHELRTPLNAIIGFSDVMRRGTLGEIAPPVYGDYAQIIHESGDHLLALINDILDISKIEAGKMELQPEALDPRSLTESSRRLISGLVKSAGSSLSVTVEDELDSIFADERALKQIIINLLSNAVKFTPAGGEIGLEAGRHGRNGS
ncbi:MAG TPA: histidine kinase dimerization/phospho-acceptor domain-containing protein, partial [Terriglobales bacterium]|nr:histidine kinase dimerization/phospho-acceptor domain-containing protein [Terriglobales bacterium]